VDDDDDRDNFTLTQL